MSGSSSGVWPRDLHRSPANEADAPLTPNPYDDITPNLASSLLRLGLPNARNAADDLVDHLDSIAGTAWSESVFSAPPFTILNIDSTSLLSGALPLDVVISLKDKGKDLVKTAQTRDLYLRGLAGYYLGIAAAVVGHNKFISRTPTPELSQILIELASASPAAWRTLFVDAANISAKQ